MDLLDMQNSKKILPRAENARKCSKIGKNIIKKYKHETNACVEQSGCEIRPRSLESGCPGGAELRNDAPGA